MKKLLLISGALLAFTASVASAQQIHLAVSDCGANGAAVLTNTCLNTGTIIIVGSVVPPAGLNHFTAMEGIVDAAQSATLSDWWRGDPAGCRNGKMSANFGFVAGPFNCTDPWSGAAFGGLSIVYPGTGSTLIPANSERFDVFCAIGTEDVLDPTQEYYLFELLISKSGTVGGCAGCNTPTSLYFNDLVLGQTAGSPGGNPDLSGNGSGQGVSYNGGNQVTPTESKSWGAIKALYR